MSNWKAGDRAVCLDTFQGISNLGTATISDRPQKGTIYLVDSVMNGMRLSTGEVVQAIKLKGIYCETMGFNSLHFRKVIPACDRESIRSEHCQ